MDTRRTVSTLVVATLFSGSPAYAQDPASSDPLEGSPSGAQYELPIDGARKDAAPDGGAREKRQNGKDDGSGVQSPIRSDNGFGASSQVPGATASATGDDDDTDADAKGAAGSKGDGGGKGASGTESSGNDAPPAVPSVPTAAAEPPDGVQAGLLLGLSALVGGGVGIAARRSRRSS